MKTRNTSWVLMIGACNLAWADHGAVNLPNTSIPSPQVQPSGLVLDQPTKTGVRLVQTGGETPASASVLELPETEVSAQQGTLTVPDTQQATEAINRTPGAVAVVSDRQFKAGPAQTIKDVLAGVPGVMTQSRYGDDARVSIRGSGLSRAYGNRGLNMYMDGVPINTSDGLVDLFEIDPTAYRYVEVYKGANALRYGANSLGGAVNFVTPTGRDAAPFQGRLDTGSFGYLRTQASSGGAQGPYDYFITASRQRFDGYRDHSDGDQERLSSNVGYRISPDAETRFYLNVNTVRQRLPGEVTRESALHSPGSADSEFERLDQQRNIDSQRLANKTTLVFGPTVLEFGVFGLNRHVKHPIYQWLDYDVRDYGGFVRTTDDRQLGDFRNRLVTGFNLHNGTIDNQQYINQPGAVKGPSAASNVDKSKNLSAYAEDSFFIRPDLALVVGIQYQHAVRDRTDRFLEDSDQSGRSRYDVFSPKLGVLWDVDEAWQVFANLSRSAEVPSYDANTFTSASSGSLTAQKAVTLEVGTRGQREALHWDVALYRSEIEDELQCLTTAPWSPCTVVNADRTVHQGAEIGLGLALLDSTFSRGDSLWLNATYTYSDFFFEDDSRYGDNDLPGVPPHYLRAELLYKHPSGIYAGPNTEWVPKTYYADNDNQVTADSYVLWNVRVGYESQIEGWSGYIEGRNLANTRYIASVAVAGTADANSAIFNPGVGRELRAGVSFTW